MRTAKHYRMLAGAVIVVAGVAVSGSLTGQSIRPAATMDDLLVEVQALRKDVAQASADSMRLQALVARVSLQEQRLKALGERLALAQRELEQAVAERAGSERRLAALEAPTEQIPTDEIQKEIAMAASMLRREIASIAAREERLRATVGELSGYVQAEEGRWAEFNQRLDDVDRALTGAPR